MCGIVAAVAPAANIAPALLEGLRKLEYRGRDSACIVLFTDPGTAYAPDALRVAELTAANKGISAEVADLRQYRH